MDLSKIQAAAALAVEKGEDQSVAKKGGGGDYVPPAAGSTRLRFISYIEIGKHERTVQGKKKTEDQVILVFELSGPKHPPRVTDDGTKIPHRIAITLNKSMNEKATFFKLFNRMNWEGKAKHMAQLLGNAYSGTVYHREWGTEGNKRTEAELHNKEDGYSIKPPRYEIVNGPEHDEPGPTGEFATLKVDPPISPFSFFSWSSPDMDQWASIFIEGTWEERKNDKGEVIAPAKSKNRHQNKIKLATNFKGSPIETLLLAGGHTIDIPDAESPDDEAPAEDGEAQPAAKAPANVPTGAAADDALAAVV